MRRKGRLDLRGVVLRLRLGAGPEEVITERDVPVDVSWAGLHSEGEPVDYDIICGVLSRFQGTSYRYIEDLASDILSSVLDEMPEGFWRISIRKPHPPSLLPMESASYTLEGGIDA